MARPKKEFPPTKTREINIRFTQEQYDVLTKNAEIARLPRAEYIRRLILNHRVTYAPTVLHDDSAILEALHSISHLGNNLNQIARYLNSGGNMTNPLARDIRESLRKLDECCNRLNREMEKEYGSH